MNQQPVVSLNASGGLLNLTQLVFEQRRLLQLSKGKEEEAYFVDYIPPARDAITLPPNVAYVLIGVVLVIVATYAIVGHLIKDLMHDLAGNPAPSGWWPLLPITLSTPVSTFESFFHQCLVSPLFSLLDDHVTWWPTQLFACCTIKVNTEELITVWVNDCCKRSTLKGHSGVFSCHTSRNWEAKISQTHRVQHFA